MRYALIGAAAALAFAAPAFSQGLHADVHAGWDRVSAGGLSDSGIGYGIGLGYDMPIGPAFVGIEGTADDSSAKKCIVGGCVKASRDLGAVIRVGTDVAPGYKLYALGGYANGRVTYAGAGTNGDGYRLGAGLQASFASKLYGKVEYRYTNYEQGFSRNQVLAGLGVEF